MKWIAERNHFDQGLVAPLFSSLQPKLAAQDQDQEVKEAAISCAATAIANLGDVSGGEYVAQLKVCSPYLEDLLHKTTYISHMYHIKCAFLCAFR